MDKTITVRMSEKDIERLDEIRLYMKNMWLIEETRSACIKHIIRKIYNDIQLDKW